MQINIMLLNNIQKDFNKITLSIDKINYFCYYIFEKLILILN